MKINSRRVQPVIGPNCELLSVVLDLIQPVWMLWAEAGADTVTLLRKEVAVQLRAGKFHYSGIRQRFISIEHPKLLGVDIEATAERAGIEMGHGDNVVHLFGVRA